MKRFLNLIGKGLLLIFLISLVQTAFSLKTESFIYFDADDYNFPIIFAVILLIISGLLMYVILHNIIKDNKSKIVLSSMFFLVTIMYFIYEYRMQSEMVSNGDEIGLKSTDTRTFKYDEKLIYFESPYKLQEQNLSNGAFNNKSFRSEDLALFYIEMDAEAMEDNDERDEKEDIKAKFDDLTVPKLFFVNCFKMQNIEIDPNAIKINELNENDTRLSIELENGTHSIMYFIRKNYFFSTMQIVVSNNSSAGDMALNIEKSILLK